MLVIARTLHVRPHQNTHTHTLPLHCMYAQTHTHTHTHTPTLNHQFLGMHLQEVIARALLMEQHPTPAAASAASAAVATAPSIQPASFKAVPSLSESSPKPHTGSGRLPIPPAAQAALASTQNDPPESATIQKDIPASTSTQNNPAASASNQMNSTSGPIQVQPGSLQGSNTPASPDPPASSQAQGLLTCPPPSSIAAASPQRATEQDGSPGATPALQGHFLAASQPSTSVPAASQAPVPASAASREAQASTQDQGEGSWVGSWWPGWRWRQGSSGSHAAQGMEATHGQGTGHGAMGTEAAEKGGPPGDPQPWSMHTTGSQRSSTRQALPTAPAAAAVQGDGPAGKAGQDAGSARGRWGGHSTQGQPGSDGGWVQAAGSGCNGSGLSRNTCGVVFFATPHFGSEYAAMGWRLRHVPYAAPAPSLARLTPGDFDRTETNNCIAST